MRMKWEDVQKRNYQWRLGMMKESMRSPLSRCSWDGFHAVLVFMFVDEVIVISLSYRFVSGNGQQSKFLVFPSGLVEHTGSLVRS